MVAYLFYGRHVDWRSKKREWGHQTSNHRTRGRAGRRKASHVGCYWVKRRRKTRSGSAHSTDSPYSHSSLSSTHLSTSPQTASTHHHYRQHHHHHRLRHLRRRNLHLLRLHGWGTCGSYARCYCSASTAESWPCRSHTLTTNAELITPTQIKTQKTEIERESEQEREREFLRLEAVSERKRKKEREMAIYIWDFWGK